MNIILKITLYAIVLALSGLAQAAPPGKAVNPSIELQGGSDSNVKWRAPSTSAYKIHVFVPKNATASQALYHVYPKGKRAASHECLSNDAKFPCYEVAVNQAQHANTWVQLTLNNDLETQWEFIRHKGYITAVATNLAATELLSLSSSVRFEDQAIQIGQTYQGGIIFYIDDTRQHGLVAAPQDQSTTGIQWYNGLFENLDAGYTAVGTGASNTKKIVNTQGEGSYAARLAADLVLNGYDDWFLPSKDELDLMYKNIGPGAAAPLTNLGGFALNNYYWSSSEFPIYTPGFGFDYSDAWLQNFADGVQSFHFKDRKLLVRAARSF